MRYILVSFLALGLVSTGCGVKGNPTPYIEAYPDKDERPRFVSPAPTTSPEPAKKSGKP